MPPCANQTQKSGSSSLLPHKNGIRAFKGTLELMSELFFASVEPGDNFTTEPIILNTALYYALGYAKGNYINFPAKKGRGSVKQNPTYIVNTESLFETVYVTPAKVINKPEFTTELNNSRSDDYVQSNTLSYVFSSSQPASIDPFRDASRGQFQRANF